MDLGDELTPLPARHQPELLAPVRVRPVTLAGALVAVAVVAAILVITSGGRRPIRTKIEPVGAPTAGWYGGAGPSASDEPAPPGWRQGAPGPLRSRGGHVMSWTGGELLVWGGDPDGDGAAYEPAGDRWRRIPAAPFPARVDALSTWTGFEALVWGGYQGAEPAGTGAAYDPIGDRWRMLPAAPLGAGVPVSGVWTGKEWILLEGLTAAAYSPRADRWQPIAPIPYPLTRAVGLWTGLEAIVIGADTSDSGPGVLKAAAYDPATDRWRALPTPPLAPFGTTAVWTGREVVAWDFELHAARLEPYARAWRRLPDLPLHFSDCLPRGVFAGDVVFAEHCGQAALYRPSTGTWTPLAHPRGLSAQPVWTGRDVLFWIGRFAGSADGTWLLRPPGARPRGPVPPQRG